jgi:hypothetical protein
MSVGPALRILASAETQAESEEVRAVAQVSSLGEDSYGKTVGPENAPAVAADLQDEVKVQIEPPAEIAVYQFTSQDGSLIVQVPSEQMLHIARDISQELAQEGITEKSAVTEGGHDNGH